MTIFPPVPLPPKPRLRGVSHLYAGLVAMVAAPALICLGTGARARIAASIYAVSLCVLFSASALYHVRSWRPRAELWMRRFDHSAIYVFIAGSYTPFCLLALENQGGVFLLVLVWSVALVGIARAIFWIHAPAAACAFLYVLQGWLLVPYLPRLATSVGAVGLTLLAVGGLFYTIGAVVFSLRRPDPFPATFGYHEVFHALVILGCLLQFTAVSRLLASTG